MAQKRKVFQRLDVHLSEFLCLEDARNQSFLGVINIGNHDDYVRFCFDLYDRHCLEFIYFKGSLQVVSDTCLSKRIPRDLWT